MTTKKSSARQKILRAQSVQAYLGRRDCTIAISPRFASQVSSHSGGWVCVSPSRAIIIELCHFGAARM